VVEASRPEVTRLNSEAACRAAFGAGIPGAIAAANGSGRRLTNRSSRAHIRWVILQGIGRLLIYQVLEAC